MKFLVITQSNGKRRVNEHDCPSFDDLHQKLSASGIEDYQAYCEISDLVESLSMRVSALERRLDESNKTSTPATVDINLRSNNVLDQQQKSTNPQEKLVEVELVNKALVAGDYGDQISFEIKFHNLSGRKIRAIKGDLVFLDLFDAEVFRIEATINKMIDPGNFSVWIGGFSCNQFMPNHIHFAQFKTEDLQLYLDDEKILF